MTTTVPRAQLDISHTQQSNGNVPVPSVSREKILDIARREYARQLWVYTRTQMKKRNVKDTHGAKHIRQRN